MIDTENQGIKPLAERWLGRSGRLFLPAWLTMLIVSIAWGWSVREQNFLTAENGLGYWLGVLGGSMMLLLLTYSVRKRLRFMRRFLSMKLWFQFHMALGIVGPLLILFHSNFSLGSLNSTVALVCMLLVAGSGFVGRYFYSRIHYGVYGEKIKLQQVEKDFQVLQQNILSFSESADMTTDINALFEEIGGLIDQHKTAQRIRSTRSARRSAREAAGSLELLIKRLNCRINPEMETGRQAASLTTQLEQCSSILMAALKKLPGLQRYERLFALWHVIHIPVFGLMVITAITHVITVHLY